MFWFVGVFLDFVGFVGLFLDFLGFLGVFSTSWGCC